MPRYRLIKLPNAEVVLRRLVIWKETTYHLLTWQKSAQIGPIIPKPLNVSGHFPGDSLTWPKPPKLGSPTCRLVGMKFAVRRATHFLWALFGLLGESMEVVENVCKTAATFLEAILLESWNLAVEVGRFIPLFLHWFWNVLYIPGGFFWDFWTTNST